MDTNDESGKPRQVALTEGLGPTNDADLLEDLQAQRAQLLQSFADVHRQIKAARARISETKKQAKEAAKRPRPSTKSRNVSMALAAIEGATIAQVAEQFGISTERVRQCIDKVFRMSMHPRRWDATGGAEHPRKLSAARLRPEPIASVLRSMLDEA